MAGTTAQQQQANGKRAAIYARVSDKSQDGEDKTSISEQTSEMEAYCEGKGLTIIARYQERTLRHHRLLEVRPPEPGHVSRRSTVGNQQKWDTFVKERSVEMAVL